MITITTPDGSTTATYVPEANMLCASLKVDSVERLDQRKGVEAYATSGSTMGIPLLYPWANRLGARSFDAASMHVEIPDDPGRIHVDETGTPIHGVIPALMPFDASTPTEGTITGTLSWTSDELLALFPFAHELELTATVEHHALSVATTVTAAHGNPVPVSFGFHPYLKLLGAPRTEWTVELPSCNALTLDERMLPTGERKPHQEQTLRLAEHAFDNAYELTTEQARFRASADAQRITVEFETGYRFAQVFSPRDADFVCFEPMTATGNALVSGDGLRVLEPGEQARAAFRISF
jgi:galactose mutarotase-like enzyme